MNKPSYEQGTFCWHELGTRDAAAARAFYCTLFGWTARDQPMPGDCGTYTLLRAGDGEVAGMYQLDGPRFEGVPSHWMAYLWVDDVAATAGKVAALGGTVVAPPMDVPGVGDIAIAQDPTGAHFGLFHGKEHPGAAQLDGSPQGTYCWDECVTADADRARGFYTALLGLTAREQEMGQGKYTILMRGERAVAGLMQRTPQMGDVPSHWMSYVVVNDCDRKAAEVDKLGGKVVAGPMDVPGIGRFAVLQDPTGAHTAFIKLLG
jgi:hypothetical protein